MAIYLNLLAEQQYAEEIRRRDPVRRTLVGSGIVVGVALGCSLILKLVCWQAAEELIASERKWQRMEIENKQLIDARRKTIDTERKLKALQALAINRFLWAPVLNAMQECILDRVQVTGLRVDQSCTPTKTTNPKDKERKSATTNITEKITLNIEARDYANNQFSRFQEGVSAHPYLRKLLANGTVRLTSLTPPAKSGGEADNRDYTLFRIEVAFPSVTRSEAK
jgi:hypothetical protein